MLRIAPANAPSQTLLDEYRMMRQEPELHRLLRERNSVPVPADFGQERIERDWLLMERLTHRQAICRTCSHNGYWLISKTIASGVGLTNARLAKQGLLSMKTLWAELAPLRRTTWCGAAC